eukprot:scaffold101_cov80-Skeletonema_menzelii.AAC.16
MVLRSTRKSSPTQQVKALIKASSIKSRAKPPPKSASPAESCIIVATSSPATSKTRHMKSPPKTGSMDSSGRSAQEKSANKLKLNQLRSKYGIKPVSLGEEREEKQTEKEVDDGNRETVEEEQPNFIDIEEMWMSVQDMTTKAAIAINPVWDQFGGSGGESPFPPGATAQEKGLAVIAAFANYKALQANAEQKTIAVEVGRTFCNASTSVKQMKTRSKRHKVQVDELNKALEEKLAAKSIVLSMWSFLTSADRQAVGGLGEIEKDLFEGIEANVFLKLGKMSKNFISSSTDVNPLPKMAQAFVCGDDDAATQNKSPGKVSETGKDDATSNESPFEKKVNSFLVSPLVAKLKCKENDDATQQTAHSNRSSLAKIGLGSLLCGDHGIAAMLPECGGRDHETVLTEESDITGGSSVGSRSSVLENLVAYIGSDESTVLTNHTAENSFFEEEDDEHDDTEAKVRCLPEKSLAP